MKKPVIIALCALSAMVCAFAGVCAAVIPKHRAAIAVDAIVEPVKTEPPTTKAQTEEPTRVVEKLNIKVGDRMILGLSEGKESGLLYWQSGNEDIVTVDDGGRIDALATGGATVTARLAQGSVVFEINVEQAEKGEVKHAFTTAIIDNLNVLRKNQKNKSKSLYQIFVNRRQNCVTVYTYDEKGEYTVPVRAMICSCGKNGATITGEFQIYFKSEWQSLYNHVYGQYVSGISGDYLFHSVPYVSPSPDRLETEEFNKLGTDASLGCVRMATSDAKWIYENCPVGTYVKIYDSDDAGPLGKPGTITINDLHTGWDPTDTNRNNPYNSKRPTFSGAEDRVIKIGSSFSATDKIKAFDTCGNDISDKVEVFGKVVTNRAGTYKLTYSVTDALHRTAEKDVWVTVES